jgi:hypothetical protein
MEEQPNNELFIDDNAHNEIIEKLDNIEEKVDTIIENVISEQNNEPVQNPFNENAMDIDYDATYKQVPQNEKPQNPFNENAMDIDYDATYKQAPQNEDDDFEIGGKKKRRHSFKKNGKKSRNMKKGGRKSLKTKKNQKGGRKSRKNVLRK